MTRVAEGLREEHVPFESFPPARTAVRAQAKTKRAKAHGKSCLVVLGMHRSGASAFARVLDLLGCDSPKSAVQASEANEGAPGQSDAIRQLNDRILAAAGTRWDDWLEVDPDCLQSPAAKDFRDEALELLRQEFGSSRLFVLEDPRMCRLVPFWLAVFEAAGVQPLILCPVRGPQAVAAALEEHDGVAPGLGHLMWLRHALDAEFASRGTRRFFTSYDQLTSGWSRTTTAASSTLGIAWPRLSNKAAAEIESFVSHDRRDDRQQGGNGLDNPTLSDWLRNTSEILHRWSVEGETPQDHATLDDIRAAMNIAAPAYSRLLETEQARVARLEVELASEREQASQLESEMESRAAAAEQELASERKQAAQLRSELESRAAAAEQELASGRQQVAQLENELESRAAAAEQQLASERQQAAQLRHDLESRAAAAEQKLASERQRQEQAAAEAEKSLAELRHRLAQTESALAQRSHETEQTAGELAALRGELRQAAAARAEAEKISVGLKQHIDLLLTDLKQRQMQAAAQADTGASLARQVKQALAELDTSRRELAARLSEAEQVRATHEQVRATHEQVRAAHEQARATHAAELQQRVDEIQALKRTVDEMQSGLHRQLSEAARLRKAAGLEIGRAAGLVNGTGFSVLPRRLRLMWRTARVKRSGLFDAEWYLRHNADVADAGMDPLRHYVEFGASEGRAPNPGLMPPNGKG